MTGVQEYNFEGIAGPTYHYAGLSYGNLASMGSAGRSSNPRKAAVEGLLKMGLLMEMGVKQAVLPPRERPHLAVLRQLGFTGKDADVLDQAYRENPALLAALSSSSSMWAANAATVTPSADALDDKVHLTPANLIGNLHRSLEAYETTQILRRLFFDRNRMIVHTPLPAQPAFGDEGAANHLRLSPNHGSDGLEVFVFGRDDLDRHPDIPTRFPARQTLLSCQAIARRHCLPPERTLFLQQNPALIDQGVFHNDVICVANEDVLLCHASAFKTGQTAIDDIQKRFQRLCGSELKTIRISQDELSVEEAVATYLFNSQIITLPGGGMALIAPAECEHNPRTRRIIEEICNDSTNPIRYARYVNVHQSMQNGGGPACLRLRVVLAEKETAGLHQAVVLTPELHVKLIDWVRRNYRDRFKISDLADPLLLDEIRTALDELTDILSLGSIYDFQIKDPPTFSDR